MSKGVIVQLNQDTAHILKNDGAFISCPRNMHWQIGDVVTISRHPWLSLKFIVAACSILLFLLIGTGIIIYHIPSTYIEVSINPSIQLTLNRFDKVLGVKGLNSDGNLVIQGTSYKNLSLDEVYARLLNRLENNYYLNNATLQLVISNNSQRKINSIEQNLRDIFEKYGQLNSLQISIKRYSNDEYLALPHPLPIKTIPSMTDEAYSKQETELPPADTSELLPDGNISALPEAPSISTIPSYPPESPLSGSPSSLPDDDLSAPPADTSGSNNWHNGNWRNGEWCNGWWDWDCGR